MTWTWALMTSVSATVNPSSTLDSSMNFFQPQSCSFLQNRCKVSVATGEGRLGQGLQGAPAVHGRGGSGRGASRRLAHSPEYFDFFGSLFTTAMVNCAKWLQPAGAHAASRRPGLW